MKVLGMSPLEITILKMISGSSGNQSYGTIGFLCSSLYKFKLREAIYRPRFLKLCAKGFLEWVDEDQRKIYFEGRKFRITKKGNQFIRELQIHYGGDFSFYRYFSGNASDLDRFLKNKVTLGGEGDEWERRRRQDVNRISRQVIARQRKLYMDYGANL